MRRALCAMAVMLALGAAARAEERPGVAEMRVAIAAERVAKLHAQLAHGVLAQRTRRAMPQAVREMEAMLALANARAVAPEPRERALLLAVLWKECRPWALKPPTRDNHRQLAERIDEIAWAAWKAARLARPEGDGASEAARGAALAQRLARLHLARRWAADAQGLEAEIAARSRELSALLEGASADEAEHDLAMARSQLDFLVGASHSVHGAPTTSESWAFLVKSADHITESLERAAIRAAIR